MEVDYTNCYTYGVTFKNRSEIEANQRLIEVKSKAEELIDYSDAVIDILPNLKVGSKEHHVVLRLHQYLQKIGYKV